jgi:hypothetical protein
MTLRIRADDANGDYLFGQGNVEFLVDSPAAVAQYVKSRLALAAGEWFLDLTEGTPYGTRILGEGTRPLYDQAIRDRILNTPGVTRIDEYVSILSGRSLSVTATITTQFGQIQFEQVV